MRHITRGDVLFAAACIAIGVILTLSIQWMIQPRMYSGCVLRYVKAGMSNNAVDAVESACAKKWGRSG